MARGGKRISTRTLNHVFNKYAKKTDERLGTDNYYKLLAKPHTLRHSFIITALDFIPVHKVMRLAGHENLSSTQRYSFVKTAE